ncbi:hypothetical protein EDE05_102442 [Neorhizobium sp. R1-B]|nr:hypothetical protein EDE05_102442 [Neorhizobium sp. R1-B]
MIFGGDDGTMYASDREAAPAAGLSVRALRAAMLKPSVEAYHRQQLIAKRNGMKALGLNTIEGVMTDPELKKTAAGAKVRVDAAKVVLVDPPGAQVNLQINNNLNVTPGYVLDLTPDSPPVAIAHDEIITIEQVTHPAEIDHERI